MASKIKHYLNPELTQFLLLSVCRDPELLPLNSLHSVSLASQRSDKSTVYCYRKVGILAE